MLEEFGKPQFVAAGEIVIASDSKATRTVAYVRRNETGNVELLSRRDGPSGSLYTLRECRPDGPTWRYLGEGESISALRKNMLDRKPGEFCGLVEGSIADVAVRHALAAIREIELKNN